MIWMIALWLLIGPAWQVHASGQGSDSTTPQAFKEEEMQALQRVLRGEVSKRLGAASEIRVDTINRQMNWIFVCGRPLTLSGNAMDYSRTLLRDRYLSGILDDYFCSLLRQTNSGIELEEFALGDTDAPFLDWLAKHGVPASILDAR